MNVMQENKMEIRKMNKLRKEEARGRRSKNIVILYFNSVVLFSITLYVYILLLMSLMLTEM